MLVISMALYPGLYLLHVCTVVMHCLGTRACTKLLKCGLIFENIIHRSSKFRAKFIHFITLTTITID